MAGILSFFQCVQQKQVKNKTHLWLRLFLQAKKRKEEKNIFPYKHHCFLPLHLHVQRHCSLPHNSYSTKKILGMDQRHNHLESLGICHRLFNFISKTLESQALKLVILCRPLSYGLGICHRFFNFTMQILAAQAVKPVILGEPGHQRLGQVPISDDSAPIATIASPRSVLNKGYKELPIGSDTGNTSHSFPSDAPQEKGLKKSVSINDTVEEIPNTSKNRKKKMAPEKLASLEREKGLEPKPLKSILKVGSKLTGKSVSFTIPPIDAKMNEAQG